MFHRMQPPFKQFFTKAVKSLLSFDGDNMSSINEVIAGGPFRASWDSLKQYSVPDWYQEAKFGIFIHWGLYAVPAFANEWNSRNMYQAGSREFKHHVDTYGPHAKFGYKD